MGAVSFFPQPKKARMRVRHDARPLDAVELAQLRRLLRVPVVEEDLDAREVARLIGLTPRTVLNMVRESAEFPGAWKPAHNRVLIPRADVEAYKERRRVLKEGAPRS